MCQAAGSPWQWACRKEGLPWTQYKVTTLHWTGLTRLMGICWRGFSQQHFKVIKIGEILIKAATGVEAILEVKMVLLSTDILTVLTVLQGHWIISAATIAHIMGSTSQGHNWVCRKGISELPGEASILTLEAGAYSGPVMEVRERANQDMIGIGLQGHV